MKKKQFFEHLRSEYERSLDKSLMQRVPTHSSFVPQTNFSVSTTPPLPPQPKSASIDNPIQTVQTIETDNVTKRNRKQVRFQVYTAKNLDSITKMRKDKEEELMKFSVERSGSRERPQEVQEELGIFSGRSSLNQRNISHEIVGEFKEETFGQKPLQTFFEQFRESKESGSLQSNSIKDLKPYEEIKAQNVSRLTNQENPFLSPKYQSDQMLSKVTQGVKNLKSPQSLQSLGPANERSLNQNLFEQFLKQNSNLSTPHILNQAASLDAIPEHSMTKISERQRSNEKLIESQLKQQKDKKKRSQERLTESQLSQQKEQQRSQERLAESLLSQQKEKQRSQERLKAIQQQFSPSSRQSQKQQSILKSQRAQLEQSIEERNQQMFQEKVQRLQSDISNQSFERSKVNQSSVISAEESPIKNSKFKVVRTEGDRADEMDTILKEFNNQSLDSYHFHAEKPERTIQIEEVKESKPVKQSKKDIYSKEKLLSLIWALDSYIGTSNSEQKLASFSKLKDYFAQVNHKIMRQQARCDYYCMRKGFRYLRYGLKKLRQYKAKKEKAKLFLSHRIYLKKKLVMGKIKKILYLERKWIEKVRRELLNERKVQYWEDWVLFVKMKKVQRMRRENLYYAFLKQLKVDSEKDEQKLSNHLIQKSRTTKHHCFQLLKDYKAYSKQRKLHQESSSTKYKRFRARKLLQNGFLMLKQHRAEQQKVRSDVFLKEAILNKQEFFQVAIQHEKGLSSKGVRTSQGKGSLNLVQKERLRINLLPQ